MGKHASDGELRAQRASQDEAALYGQLESIIERHKQAEGALVRVLDAAQELFGCLPEKAQARIADGLDIPLSEVQGVLSTHSFSTAAPRGEHTIKVCLGTACELRGGKQVLEKFEHELGIPVNGTTDDRKVSLEVNYCFGACNLAPVVTVGPDIYRRVEMDKIPEIIDKYRSRGGKNG